MAIRKTTQANPFLDGESAIAALGTYIDGTATNRGGMYLLNIINSYIQDGERIFERIPQEVFGGLPGGGRRNVQASALIRAKRAADGPLHRSVLESGYTPEQELIGFWAERDGSWHDTPEADLISKGHRHRSYYDGSEARIFYNDKSHIYKTLDFSHYESIERGLDRIAIHNALFPEAQMFVAGFGIRDYAEDNDGFCIIIKQPFIKGKVPTKAQIQRSMIDRGLRLCSFGAGLFYETPSSETLVTDIHPGNSAYTGNGNVVVFDCEAMVNDIPGFGGKYKIPELKSNPESVALIKKCIEAVLPQSVTLQDFLESIPEKYASKIRTELLSQGHLNEPVQDGQYYGHLVQMDPEKEGNVIVMSPDAINLFFRMHHPVQENGQPVDKAILEKLKQGLTAEKNGVSFRFDIDKGRIIETLAPQLKLKQTQMVEKEKKQSKPKTTMRM